ncbi:aerolysin-like protein [Tachysurus vachellii]|uniref:aerolysin-like protein n=1 Tax=Tachysurus vachellii TaxID=175792 RepID=UPI00296ABA35|nr:aerolysin-like protein [Tachysurus vachellii]
MLKTIQVWEGDCQIKAMKVWLTDDRFEQFGDPAGNLKEFTFGNREYFSSLSLFPNQDGSRLGAIKFETCQSREFYAAMINFTLQPEVKVDVASGICMGIKGRSGLDIDRLGFMFNLTADLTNVVYPTIPDVIPKVAVGEIKSMSYQNQDMNYNVAEKLFKGNMEFTVSLKVSAGIPCLAVGKTTYELKIGVEDTYASDISTEKMELFSFPVKVPAGKTVDVRVTLGQATVDLPFTGIMKITCYNGSVLEYKTSGTYKGVTYSDGKVVVNESNKKLGAA